MTLEIPGYWTVVDGEVYVSNIEGIANGDFSEQVIILGRYETPTIDSVFDFLQSAIELEGSGENDEKIEREVNRCIEPFKEQLKFQSGDVVDSLRRSLADINLPVDETDSDEWIFYFRGEVSAEELQRVYYECILMQQKEKYTLNMPTEFRSQT